jgi:hypothetical protein
MQGLHGASEANEGRMPTIITCPSCEKQLRLPDELIGRPVQCPTCGNRINASMDGNGAPPPPMPASPPDPPSPAPRAISPFGFDMDLSLDNPSPTSSSSPSQSTPRQQPLSDPEERRAAEPIPPWRPPAELAKIDDPDLVDDRDQDRRRERDSDRDRDRSGNRGKALDNDRDWLDRGRDRDRNRDRDGDRARDRDRDRDRDREREWDGDKDRDRDRDRQRERDRDRDLDIDKDRRRSWREGEKEPRRDAIPHRGGTILALGVTGLALMFVTSGMFFPISLVLGLCAWIMGGGDLRRMQAGEMDPEGHGSTMGGYICGIIATLFATLVTLSCISIVVLVALSDMNSGGSGRPRGGAPAVTPAPRQK